MLLYDKFVKASVDYLHNLAITKYTIKGNNMEIFDFLTDKNITENYRKIREPTILEQLILDLMDVFYDNQQIDDKEVTKMLKKFPDDVQEYYLYEYNSDEFIQNATQNEINYVIVLSWFFYGDDSPIVNNYDLIYTYLKDVYKKL